MEKKITVVMSAYNHEEYVEKAIQSVLSQTYKNFKFIVADDASTDRTVEKIMKYENIIDEIHLYDENSGSGREVELGIQSDTKYIAIINSDDCWEPQKLEKQVKYLEEHSECGACFTWCDEIDEDGNLIDKQVFKVKNRTKEEWMYRFWKRGNCLAYPSVLIRTDIYKKICNRNIDVYRQLPDYYIWLQLIQEWEIYILEENLVKFCHHSRNANVSANTIVNSLRNDMEAEYIWYKIMKEMEIEYFKKAFSSVLINSAAQGEKEIICEKYFSLCISPIQAVQSAAILYYYDVFEKTENYNELLKHYGYTNKMFYQQEIQMGKGKFQLDLLKR